MSEQLSERLDTWALVDLMGHQRVAGHVSEATIAGGAFLRVDVPEVGDDVAHTRYVGPSAIYSISPVSEETARAMAVSLRQRPVQQYELPKLKAPEGADGQLMERSAACVTCGRYGPVDHVGRCGDCNDEMDQNDDSDDDDDEDEDDR